MAEFLLKIKRDSRPDPAFQDGDIIHATNQRRIRDVHAQHICHKRNAGFQPNGLRLVGTLIESRLAAVMQYKFERISAREVRRTNFLTLDVDVLSDTPNAGGEYIHLVEYIQRRLRHPTHLMFGAPGREVWYGGNTISTNANLDKVWQEIEAKTAHREADYTRFTWTDAELKNYLTITVDDFDNAERAELEESVYDLKDPDNPILMQKRKRMVDWQNVLGLSAGDKSNITAPGTTVDIRSRDLFTRADIVTTKSD